MKIGIIGGYGKFGTQLAEKLEAGGFEVLRSPDKSKNVELARASEILFLSVPPSQLEAVVREIRDVVGQTEVISCAAFVDVENVAKVVRSNCVRIMCDPQFHLLAILGSPEKGMDALDCLTERQVRLQSDEEINHFTKLISVFFVVLSIKGANSRIFLEAYNQLLPFFSDEDLRKALSEIVALEGGLYLTKGGISEFVTNQIHDNPEISFEELLRSIDEKF